jgi:hypothetical protein
MGNPEKAERMGERVQHDVKKWFRKVLSGLECRPEIRCFRQ